MSEATSSGWFAHRSGKARRNDERSDAIRLVRSCRTALGTNDRVVFVRDGLDRTIEGQLIVRAADSPDEPAVEGGGDVAAMIPLPAHRLVMARMNVDLDGPFQVHDRQVEAGSAMPRQVDVVLTNESSDPGTPKRVGDSDLGMRFGCSASEAPIELIDVLASPRPAWGHPVESDRAQLVVAQATVVGGLLDHGKEVVRRQPAGQVERGSGE